MCYDVRGFANGVLNSYYFLIKYRKKAAYAFTSTNGDFFPDHADRVNLQKGRSIRGKYRQDDLRYRH